MLEETAVLISYCTEDAGSGLLQNFDTNLPNCMVSHPRRWVVYFNGQMLILSAGMLSQVIYFCTRCSELNFKGVIIAFFFSVVNCCI